MSTRREPLPPIARTITPFEWVLVLGLWLMIELMSVDELGPQLAARGVSIEPRHLAIAQSVDWLLWALLLPFIFRALDRLPLRGRRWPLHLLGWGALCAAMGLLHAALSLPVYHALARLLGIGTRVFATTDLKLPALWSDDSGNATLALLAYLPLQFAHRARAERNRAAEIERSLREARLHALALELQPHFLFNTLNGIAALVRSDPVTAERMLIRLSDLLRLTLDSGEGGLLPLAEEERRLGLYLALQQMRQGERLTVESRFPPELARLAVPAMLLQPLVENAISHGLGARSGPGRLEVSARQEGEWLELMVEDDGVGVPAAGPPREGIGLGNTRSRLTALYGERQSLRIEPREGGGTRVTVRLPATALPVTGSVA